jgi:hypothetical protein
VIPIGVLPDLRPETLHPLYCFVHGGDDTGDR